MKKSILIIILLIASIGSRAQVLSTSTVLQEQSGWCWAASTRCILLYMGVPNDSVTQCRIVDYARRMNPSLFGTTPCCVKGYDSCNNGAETLALIADVLTHFGELTTTTSGPLSAEDIEKQMACKRLFIIRWEEGGVGHAVVCHGYEDGILYIMNPWPGEGETMIPLSSLTSGSGKVWKNTIALNQPAGPGTITGGDTICIGQTATLEYVPPGGTWSSSNTGIVTIGSASGIATGVAAGTAKITFQANNGCTAKKQVTVCASPPAITGTTTLCVSYTATLGNTMTGGTWSGSNADVATIDGTTGLWTAVSAGTAVISYIMPSKCMVTVTVTVTAGPGAITGTFWVCVGSTRTLTGPTTGGTWSSSNATKATVGSASGIVTGVAAGTANISYTTGEGCAAVVNFSVNAAPGAFTGPSSVCKGATITLTNAGGPGTWSSSDADVAEVGSATGIVTGKEEGTATITYTNGCGDPVAKEIKVNPLPRPIFFHGSSVCITQPVLLKCKPDGGTWSSSAPGIATVGADGTVTGVAEGATTITYTLETGCISTKTLNVGPIPTVAAITGAGPVCIDKYITLSCATPGGTWMSLDVDKASVGSSSGNVFGRSKGDATIRYTVKHSSGCSNEATVSVTVSDTTMGKIEGSRDICIEPPAAGTTTLTCTPAGGTWSSWNPDVATVDAATGVVTSVITGYGSALIRYVVTTAAGCKYYKNTVVNIIPKTKPITGPASICVGATGTMQDESRGGSWISSDTDILKIDDNGVITGKAVGTVIVSYAMLSNSCGNVTKEVTVKPAPGPIKGNGKMCAGSTLTLTNDTAGGTWSSDNYEIAGIDAEGVVTGVTPGTANIAYTLESGCNVTVEVTVYPMPDEITGTKTVCVGNTTTLSNTTSGGTWSSDNYEIAGVDAEGVVTGVTPGTANIAYTTEAGCYVTVEVTVYPMPDEITGTKTVCVGSTTTLSNTTSGGTWSSDNYEIAGVDEMGIVTGVTPGTANIAYTTEGGCYVTVEVTVYPMPAEITGTKTVCVGSTTTLSNTTSGGTWSSDNYEIAGVGEMGIVTGVTPGTANIAYTTEGGCYVTVEVTVYPMPDEITGTTSVCEGSTTTLSSTTPGGTWSSSNEAVATVDGEGAVSGVEQGTATITYTADGGCYVVAEVTVYPMPAEITGTMNLCLESTTTLYNTTPGGTWSSSNADIAEVDDEGVVTGTFYGTATITYTLEGGCYVTAEVTVYPPPVALEGTRAICEGKTTSLSSETLGGTWSSSDEGVATVSSDGTVTGLEQGMATITYTTNGTCYVRLK